MKGTVVPSYFWNDADHFLDKSIGFTALHDGRIAATAYAAFIIDKSLEIGIETVEEFRGMKLAQVTCSSLIDYAIENNYEPIWACRLENTGSYLLAQKLGFEPTVYRPYYKLAF
jgi:RimJ/RimL family protein N-acetyltransferase